MKWLPFGWWGILTKSPFYGFVSMNNEIVLPFRCSVNFQIWNTTPDCRSPIPGNFDRLRLTGDTLRYCCRHVEKWNRISIVRLGQAKGRGTRTEFFLLGVSLVVVFRGVDPSENDRELSLNRIRYAAGQLPCGILIQHYGTRWPLLGAMTISSVCLLLLPVSAVTGDWMATCAIRVLQGFSQGALFPALYSAIAKWTPLQERGRLASIIFTGEEDEKIWLSVR